MKVRITEYLNIDLKEELWCCNRCQHTLGPAKENYKTFLLVCERNLEEVYSYSKVLIGGYRLGPDPEWCRMLEFYCPNCGTLFEVEYLPPGHPITHDIELDIEALKARYTNP